MHPNVLIFTSEINKIREKAPPILGGPGQAEIKRKLLTFEIVYATIKNVVRIGFAVMAELVYALD